MHCPLHIVRCSQHSRFRRRHLFPARMEEKITQQAYSALSEDSARRLPDLDILTQSLADVNTLLEYVYTSGIEILLVL